MEEGEAHQAQSNHVDDIHVIVKWRDIGIERIKLFSFCTLLLTFSKDAAYSGQRLMMISYSSSVALSNSYISSTKGEVKPWISLHDFAWKK